jgi:predicted CxxxxCH...CXXCH cytochrome family protein
MEANPADGRDTNGNTANTDDQVGAHVAHLNNTRGYTGSGIACSECHTVPAGATYVDKVKATGHIDSDLPAEVPLAGTIATANTTTPDPYVAPGGTCSNTYCHDGTNIKNGWSTAAQIEFETPDWNTPIMNGTIDDCDNCHGNPPAGSHTSSTSCNSCHTHVNATQDGFLDASLHIDGAVIAQQGGACNACHAYPPTPGDGKTEEAIEGKGAHQVHVDHLTSLLGLTLQPDTDEFGTGTPAAVCGICHTNVVGNHMDTTRLINFGDGSTAYQFGPTAPAYNGTIGVGGATDPKTCSNISCHFTETPEWEPRQ